MYGSKVNLVGETGTLAVWIKALKNTIPASGGFAPHRFFIASNGRIQFIRDQNAYNSYAAAGGGGYFYGELPTLDDWMFFTLTWRKGEQIGYVNGRRTWTSDGPGDSAPIEDRFLVAQDAFWTPSSPSARLEDDTVMDELQIFRRPLAASEVVSLFERGHVVARHSGGSDLLPLIVSPERAYAPTAIGGASRWCAHHGGRRS